MKNSTAKVVLSLIGIAVLSACGGSDSNTADRFVAVDDNAQVQSNNSVIIDVLENDTGAHTESLEITKVSKPKYGKTVISDGKITYVPKRGFVGLDGFNYTAYNGVNEDKAEVTVVVFQGGVVSRPVIAGSVVSSDIVNNGYILNGLGEHSVIDASANSLQQQGYILPDKVQTITLLAPELIQNRAAIRFHVCENNVEPDTGACTMQPLARYVPVSSNTIIFSLMPIHGKAGLEHNLYLSVATDGGMGTYYREKAKKKFIFPQDHYQLVTQSQKLDNREVDGFQLESDTREIRFNIVEKASVMAMLKTDEEVDSFSAKLYSANGKHIKDLRVHVNNNRPDFPYSILANNKNNVSEIQLKEGSYLLHIDFPFTSIPLEMSHVMMQEEGAKIIYAPNGFIMPLNVWGSTTVAVTIDGRSVNRLGQNELKSFRDGFFIRPQPDGSLGYRNNEGWLFSRHDLALTYQDQLERACEGTENDIFKNENINRRKNSELEVSDLVIEFTKLDGFTIVKNNWQKEKTNLMLIERLSGQYEIGYEINCGYSFNVRTTGNSESARLVKTQKRQGSITLPMEVKFTHNAAAVK